MSNPKFEESYNPNKHYDPDRERTEAAKLKKEFKRERKGAIRELRRDAKVMARDNLRDKKEKDAAYEKVCAIRTLGFDAMQLLMRSSEHCKKNHTNYKCRNLSVFMRRFKVKKVEKVKPMKEKKEWRKKGKK